MNADANHEFHQILLRQAVERVEMNYLRASDRGAVDPVVLVLDPLDDRARSIAEEFAPPGRTSALVAQAIPGETLPVILWGVPLRVAIELVEARFPDSEEAIGRAYPPEGYLAIVIARETFLAVEMPPVPA